MDSFLIHIYFSCSSNIYYLWKIETFAQYIFVVQTDTKVINIVLVVHIVLDCFGPYNVVRYNTLCTIFEGTITVEIAHVTSGVTFSTSEIGCCQFMVTVASYFVDPLDGLAC